MHERIDASFAVSLFGWAEVRRDLQLAFLRFGVGSLRLRGRWCGLHVVVEVSATETPERVDVLVRFLEDYAASAGTRLELTRTVAGCTSSSSSMSSSATPILRLRAATCARAAATGCL